MRDHHRVGVKNEGALPIIVMVLVSLVDQPRLVRKITFITYFVKHIKLFSSHVSCLVIVKAGSSVFFHCIGPHVLQSSCFFFNLPSSPEMAKSEVEGLVSLTAAVPSSVNTAYTQKKSGFGEQFILWQTGSDR